MTHLIAALVLGPAPQSAGPPAEWLRGTVIYAVVLDRFENGSRGNDPPGVSEWASDATASSKYGGDVDGLEKRWPHIRDLGVRAVALVPPVADGVVRDAARAVERGGLALAIWGRAPDARSLPTDTERETDWRAAVLAFARNPGSEPARVALESAAKAGAARWGLNLVSDPGSDRLRTMVSGSRSAERAAILLQFCLPGTPVVLAGDETGMEGRAIAPMDWTESRWDAGLLSMFTRLIALRQGSAALREGSMRLATVGPERGVYAVVRERGRERVVALINRTEQSQSVRLDRSWAGSWRLVDALSGRSYDWARGAPTVELPARGSTVLSAL